MIEQLSTEHQKWLDNYFYESIFPILTPLAIQIDHPFPLLANGSLNIAIKLKMNVTEDDKMYIIQISELIDPTIQVPDPNHFVFVEYLLNYYLDPLFPDTDV